jgi:hypothetical protein
MSAIALLKKFIGLVYQYMRPIPAAPCGSSRLVFGGSQRILFSAFIHQHQQARNLFPDFWHFFSGSFGSPRAERKTPLWDCSRGLNVPTINRGVATIRTRPIRWAAILRKFMGSLSTRRGKHEPEVRAGQEDSIFLL